MSAIPGLDAAQFNYDLQLPEERASRDNAMRVAPKMTAGERLLDERWSARRAFLRTTGNLWTCSLPVEGIPSVEANPGIRLGMSHDLKADMREMVTNLRTLADQIEDRL